MIVVCIDLNHLWLNSEASMLLPGEAQRRNGVLKVSRRDFLFDIAPSLDSGSHDVVAQMWTKDNQGEVSFQPNKTSLPMTNEASNNSLLVQ